MNGSGAGVGPAGFRPATRPLRSAKLGVAASPEIDVTAAQALWAYSQANSLLPGSTGLRGSRPNGSVACTALRPATLTLRPSLTAAGSKAPGR